MPTSIPPDGRYRGVVCGPDDVGELSAEWTEATALAPSPIAAATRFIDPFRTSPTAKTPGTEVSNGNGRRASAFHCGPRSSLLIWVSVHMNPLLSVRTSGNQLVSGSAP